MKEFTPFDYLRIDLANHYGLDKLSFPNRIAWVNANMPFLKDWAQDAESPELFSACLDAINLAMEGEPITHCISLDATASGLQVLAALTGCRNTARLTNLIDTGERMDIYTHLHKLMGASISASMDLPTLPRDKVKKAVMTAFYGSVAIPKSLFNKKELVVFYRVLEKECPWPWQLNTFLLSSWNKKVSSYHWLMPDAHTVHIPVTNVEYHRVTFMEQQITVPVTVKAANPYGKSLSANLVHSVDGFVVREMVRRCNYNPENVVAIQRLLQEPKQKQSRIDSLGSLKLIPVMREYRANGFLSAVVIDLLAENPCGINMFDAQERKELALLLASLPSKPFPILPIHDCFRCHPNYGNDLRQQYRLILSALARSNLLQHLLRQMLGQEIVVEVEEDLSQEILQSVYALC